MATILPFRAPQRGDWSANERARLDELAARFAHEAGVEIAYGLTDSGDPWCVVLDARDEVLVHVAREGGNFVAHTADDLFVRSTDLATAVERVLGTRWNEDRADVVVPFAGAAGRASAQVVTAVLVVASFIYHHQAEAQPTESWSFAGAKLSDNAGERESRDPAKLVPAANAVAEKDLSSAAAAGMDETPLPPSGLAQPVIERAPRHEAMADTSPGQHIANLIIEASADQASDVPSVTTGTDGADRLELDGKSTAPHGLLDGGAGDDHLILDEGTVAIGGEGADTFDLRAPDGSNASTLLGIIVDFDPLMDKLISTQPGTTTVTVLDQIELPNIFDDPNFSLGSLSASTALPVLPGQRLMIDLNGDGIPDGYLLMNSFAPEPVMISDVRQAFGGNGDRGTGAGVGLDQVGSGAFDSHHVAPVFPTAEPIAMLAPPVPEVI